MILRAKVVIPFLRAQDFADAQLMRMTKKNLSLRWGCIIFVHVVSSEKSCKKDL